MINFSSGLQIFYVSGRCRAGLYMKGKIFLDTLTKLSGARTSSFLAVSLRFFYLFPPLWSLVLSYPLPTISLSNLRWFVGRFYKVITLISRYS